MATFTASAAQANSPALMSVNRVITRVCEYTHQATSLSTGDVIQMIKVPNGALVTNVQVSCSFSAGVETVNIGDGNDISCYGASVVLSGAGVMVLTSFMPFRGVGRSYSAEDTIDIVVAGSSAGPVSATIRMAVTYTMQSGQ